MPTFRLSCPHCSGHLEAEDDWIGIETACPHCGKNLVVCRAPVHPVLPAVAEAAPAKPAEPAPVGDTKECPFCAETIKAQAVTCRYCKADLSRAQPTLVDSRNKRSKMPKGTAYTLLGVGAFLSMFILCLAILITLGVTQNWSAGVLVMIIGVTSLTLGVLRAMKYIASNCK